MRNHEYVNDERMFSGRLGAGRAVPGVLADRSKRHPEAVQLEMAAHGVSVLQIERDISHRFVMHILYIFSRSIPLWRPLRVSATLAEARIEHRFQRHCE
jgi:secreted PhoX family phosphatase